MARRASADRAGCAALHALLAPLGQHHTDENATQYSLRKHLHFVARRLPALARALRSAAHREVAHVVSFVNRRGLEDDPRNFYSGCTAARWTTICRRLLGFASVLSERADAAEIEDHDDAGLQSVVEELLLDPFVDFDAPPRKEALCPSVAVAFGMQTGLVFPWDQNTGPRYCFKGVSGVREMPIGEQIIANVVECLRESDATPIESFLVPALHGDKETPDYGAFLAGVYLVAKATMDTSTLFVGARPVEMAALMIAHMIAECERDGDTALELASFARAVCGLGAGVPPAHPRHRARFLVAKAAVRASGDVNGLVRTLAARAGDARAGRFDLWCITLFVSTRELRALALFTDAPLACLGMLRAWSAPNGAPALCADASTPLDLMCASPEGTCGWDDEQLMTNFTGSALRVLDGEARLDCTDGVEYAAFRSIYRLCTLPFESLAPRWRDAVRALEPSVEHALVRVSGGAAVFPCDGASSRDDVHRARHLRARTGDALRDALQWTPFARANESSARVLLVATHAAHGSPTRVFARWVVHSRSDDCVRLSLLNVEAQLRVACASPASHTPIAVDADETLLALGDETAKLIGRAKLGLKLQLAAAAAGVRAHAFGDAVLDDGA
jgi:hypothetical protein